MIRRFLTFYSFILLCGGTRSFAQSNESVSLQIRKGMEYVYNLDFVRSDSIFNSIIERYPGHPQGYYFKASSCFYQIISGYRTETNENDFIELNDKAIAVAEELENSDLPAGQFYRGTAYGNIARYHAMKGDFIKAFYYAKKSKNIHEELIERYPDHFDAYLTVGVYNYYAAALPRWMDAVAGLFGLGGDRDLGIRHLETAYEKGDLARIEAKFFLANVYYEEGNYEKSVKLYQELSSEFSKNPFLLNQLGFLYYSMDRFDEAESTFKNAGDAVTANFMSSKMFTDYFLGRISKLKNDYASALHYLNEASEIGSNQKLFKSIDAWIVGAAYYQTGEVMELAGNRSSAIGYYEQAKGHEQSGKSIVQASKNRLQYGLSGFEIDVMRSRHMIIYGQISEGRKRMEELKLKARNGNDRFLSQINFYLGRAEFSDSNFQKAGTLFAEAIRIQADDGDRPWREPQTHFYLGLCYVKLGQKDLAKEELKRVLKYDQYLEAPRFKFRALEMLNAM